MKRIRIALCLLLATQLIGCATSTSVQKQFSAIATVQRAADDAYAHGDMQTALQGYDALTRMAPKEPSYWFRLGNVQYRINLSEAAIVDYQRAIMLKPDYSEAWYNLGIVQMHLAEGAFVKAAQHAPANDPLGAYSAHLVDGISMLMEPGHDAKPAAPAAAAASTSTSTSASSVDKQPAAQGGGS